MEYIKKALIVSTKFRDTLCELHDEIFLTDMAFEDFLYAVMNEKTEVHSLDASIEIIYKDSE